MLRLTIPPRHVGGTFVETPGRIGPFRAANGDLYFIMEPAETSNLFMMMKSTDDGLTWREVDGPNRPPTRDLESVDARQVGDTIHVLHEVSRSARYHSFRTSDHPTRPDTWAVRDELVAASHPVAQAAALEVRADRSVVAFYVGPTKIHYTHPLAVRRMVAEKVIDPDVAPNLAGPQAVLGANDTVHLAYYGTDGTIWYRRLLPDGTLTSREQLATGAGISRAEYGSVLPLIYIPQTNTVVIIYRLASGALGAAHRERRPADGRGESDGSGRGHRCGRLAAAGRRRRPGWQDGSRPVHRASSRSIFSTHDRDGWQPSTLRVDRFSGRGSAATCTPVGMARGSTATSMTRDRRAEQA